MLSELKPLLRKLTFRKKIRYFVKEYEYSGDDPRDDMRERYGYVGQLGDIYMREHDALVHKWHHYLPVYERYFEEWRGKPLRFLEIGVSKGGSLDMWRQYFGPEAIIYGIDVNPECAELDGKAGQVRIGSQDDPQFLESVVKEMGGIDIVLDDGSHVMKHLRKSLEVLYPLLEDGGVYMIEDLHTAYWERFGGGLKQRSNFFNDVAEIVQDMHHWFHEGKMLHPGIGNQVDAMHVHNSIVVLEKGSNPQPANSMVLNGTVVPWS